MKQKMESYNLDERRARNTTTNWHVTLRLLVEVGALYRKKGGLCF